jgi:drug/metabolite transporter (DMT)-like permease
MNATSPLLWLVPSFVTLFLYGIGQGLVKKWSGDVPPAKFCLYLILARMVVNIGYFLYGVMQDPAALSFSSAEMGFALVGVLAYILDGLGWILYFESIILGPITIVGTLSAAYPALTLLFAQIFLKEQLLTEQYLGVGMVIFGCLGLSYSPADPEGKTTNRRWIPLALAALACWGAAQTLVKYSYSLPGAMDSHLALYSTLGGILTLGMYGLFKGRKQAATDTAKTPFMHSFLPMAMMAGGDLGVIIASATGPASIVAPLTGAYPLVTLLFAAWLLKEAITRLQWLCLVILLAGISFSTIPQAPEDPSAAETPAVTNPNAVIGTPQP